MNPNKIVITILASFAFNVVAAPPVKDVNIANTPLPVEGVVDVTGSSVTIDNDDASAVPVRSISEGIPVQFKLQGLFSDGSFNLGTTILGPMSYTIPEDFGRMLLKYVSCNSVQQPGVRVVINLDTSFTYETTATPRQAIVKLMTSDANRVDVPTLSTGVRYAESANVHVWLGITTPGGPEIGDTLFLSAQRSTTSGTGGVTCIVTGELMP